MAESRTYFMWLVAGPRCPSQQPSERGPGRLPVALATALQSGTSVGYWWIEANAERRRAFLYFRREPQAEGQYEGWVASTEPQVGTELEQRSTQAADDQVPLFAFGVTGDKISQGASSLDGTRILLPHAACGMTLRHWKPGTILEMSPLDQEILTKDVVEVLPGNSAAGAPTYRIGGGGPATHVTGSDAFVLVLGPSLIAASATDTQDGLLPFLMHNGREALIGTNQSPGDFLVTPPVASSATCDGWHASPYRTMRSATYRWLRSRVLPERWPPMLRALAATQDELRDFELEGGYMRPSYRDPRSTTLEIQVNDTNAVSVYRKRALQVGLEAPRHAPSVDQLEQGLWRQEIHRRAALRVMSRLGELGWDRIDIQAPQARKSVPDHSLPRLIRVATPPPIGESTLRPWIDYLQDEGRAVSAGSRDAFSAALELLMVFDAVFDVQSAVMGDSWRAEAQASLDAMTSELDKCFDGAGHFRPDSFVARVTWILLGQAIDELHGLGSTRRTIGLFLAAVLDHALRHPEVDWWEAPGTRYYLHLLLNHEEAVEGLQAPLAVPEEPPELVRQWLLLVPPSHRTLPTLRLNRSPLGAPFLLS